MMREIHLVDIENLLGTPRFTAGDAASLRELYASVSGSAANAQIVIGSSSWQSLFEAGLGWPSARQVWLPGTDGADRALLDVAMNERIEHRFERVVIGSGDGIFAGPAAILQAAGCAVTVVSRRGALSSRLRLAVRDIRFLPSARDTAAVQKVA